MFQISIDKYIIWVGDPASYSLPFSIDSITQKDIFDYVRVDYGHETEIQTCLMVVQHHDGHPFLMVQLWYWSGKSSDSLPRILYVPETEYLFIGAGERILAYDLTQSKQIWENTASWFQFWRRVGDYVLMDAKEELAVWNLSGEQLWSMWAHPYRKYRVENNIIYLEEMEHKSSFSIEVGPTESREGFELGFFDL